MASKSVLGILGIFVTLAGLKSMDLEWACAEGIEVLRDSANQVLWLSPEQLEAQAISRVNPSLPSTARAEGCVHLEVLVDETGKVRCLRATTGHPLLQAAAMKAMKEWRFRPWTSSSKPISALGRFSFHFSTSSGVSTVCPAQPP